jgi:biotin carboxyl carrier protein
VAKDKIFQGLEDGQHYSSRVERRGDGYDVHAAGLEARVVDTGGGNWLVSTATGSVVANVELRDGEIEVSVGHERFRFRAVEGAHSGKRRQSVSGRAEVTAPMPGKVIKLLAAPGESVDAGQGVLLFEAMKMQNEIRSPTAGRLTEIRVQPGQAVVARECLFIVEAKE